MNQTEQKPQNRRLVLTSVNQLMMLIKNNPKIVQVFPGLNTLQTKPLSETPKKSCNCGAKQNITTPDANKQIAESILSSASTEDFMQIKSVLDVDELCYYKRQDNKLEMICL